VVVRVVVAIVILAIAAGIAWWLEHRRVVAPPSQGRAVAPEQLDRNDFPRPEAPWLVVLFTSRHCESCAGLVDKALPLASDEVAVAEVEYTLQPDLHARYRIDAAPITVVVDHEGVTRAAFIGAYAAPELWSALAEVRATPS
jgi:copper chaperone CopZ